MRSVDVSIPNGMEFYNTLSWLETTKYRFNSQRDGILRFILRFPFLSIRFQFPTGWNSTKYRLHSERSEAEVSIPNGMEFYHIRLYRYRACSWFQFPTGWNSTRTLAFEVCKNVCFNSQRDGILRNRNKKSGTRTNVSIPNGMEFYLALAAAPEAIRTVSIPNGMEFYLSILPPFLPPFLLQICFNSQRDGILHFLTFWLFRLARFQFPTGWNSTPL